MTKTNRLSFVVPLVLTFIGVLAPGTVLGQGLPQHAALWYPQPWPEYRPAMPEDFRSAPPESAPLPAARTEEPTGRGGKRSQARASGPAADGAGSGKGKQASRAKPLRNRGIASWYGKRFHGRKTASGERFDMHAMTAAHRTLPLPSYVRVTNPTNGASVVVLVNDRGPYARNRIIDLSYAAARALGITKRGTAPVELEVLPNPPTTLAAASGEQSSPLAEATVID